MTELQIESPHGLMPAYLARPAGRGPWPAVIVIHDANGMGKDTRRQADWLASDGYLAVAPNLFASSQVARCMWTVFGNIRSGRGRYFDQVEATREWLGTRPDCTGRVGVIGFCTGGGFALALAPDNGFDAAGANYGLLPADAEMTLAAACPIVSNFGAKDRSLPGAAVRLNRVLDMLGIPRDVKEYTEGAPGFINDHRDERVPWHFALMARFRGGVDEHEPSAENARRRIIAFFGRHLATPLVPEAAGVSRVAESV